MRAWTPQAGGAGAPRPSARLAGGRPPSVSFEAPEDPDQNLLKRVPGVPADRQSLWRAEGGELGLRLAQGPLAPLEPFSPPCLEKLEKELQSRLCFKQRTDSARLYPQSATEDREEEKRSQKFAEVTEGPESRPTLSSRKI